jgi:cation transport ATPase
MLNEEKIRLMTRLALYEKNQLKEDETAENYFKTDYISKQLLGSLVSGTIAFLVAAGAYAAYNFDIIMLSIYSADVKGLLRQVLFDYVLFMAAFLLITWVIYAARYRKSRRGLHRYFSALKKTAARLREDPE